jgi:nucleotide-binding universal stress UspA family protein
MANEIVVGFDESRQARDALALGRELAAAIGGHLVVTRVLSEAGVPDEPLVTDAEPAGLTNVEHVSVVNASAARALHNLAEERRAVAIVVGSTGRGTLGRVAPGSVGRRLLGGAPCAVAVAPIGLAERPVGLGAIGVAFDGEPESMHALDAAVRLSRRLDGHVKVHAVVRWRSPPETHFSVTAGAIRFAADAAEELDRASRAAIAAFPDPPTGGVDVRVGDPVTILADASKELDLLVCGSRGRGRAQQVLLGSVSAELVDRVHCALLVIPRGGQRVEEDPVAGTDPAASARR